MASWIYIFSKFTPEALLFESLLICLLCAGYAAFWVLRKRKYGVLGADTPAYAVKSYLSQLILDAEQMRIQLFGLLAGTGVDPNVMASLRAASAAGMTAAPGTSPLLSALGMAPGASATSLTNDPELAAKLTAIEAKMVEQAKGIETITIEKTRLEKELVEARAGKGGGGGGGEAPVDNKLAEKIKALEAKLAEYSVIEDDLANLKRLQQENTQLKAQLGGKAPKAAAQPMAAESEAGAASVSAPMATDPSTGSVSEPEAAAPAADGDNLADTPLEVPAVAGAEAAPAEVEAAAAAEAVAATDAAITEAAAATPLETAAPAAEPIAAATGDPGFEGLVDQVEQSLVEPVAAATPVAEPAAGASSVDPAAGNGQVQEAAASAPASAPAGEKSDADLVAEFEKMLNS